MNIISRLWQGLKGLFGRKKGDSPSSIPNSGVQDVMRQQSLQPIPQAQESTPSQQLANGGQIVNIKYGHGHGGGKTYPYKDPIGTRRVGQNVVVDVTHPKSGKTYKTLGTIASTHGGNTVGARDTEDYLDDRGIGLKTLQGGLSQTQLPGYYRGWKADAQAKYDLETEYKLLPGMIVKNSLGDNVYSEAYKSIQKQIANLRYTGKNTTRMRGQGDYNRGA